MRSITENIYLSTAKQPTKKLFWPWFLPIFAGSSYTKPSETVGDVERDANHPANRTQGRCCRFTISIFWLGKNDFELKASFR